MISPELHDFSPFFLLISSPLGTADFLVLLELSGDGYSLLCSKIQPPRHNHVKKTGEDVLCAVRGVAGVAKTSAFSPANEISKESA
jgi:hypothetical protein